MVDMHRFPSAGRCAFHFSLGWYDRIDLSVGVPFVFCQLHQDVVGFFLASPLLRMPPKGNLVRGIYDFPDLPWEVELETPREPSPFAVIPTVNSLACVSRRPLPQLLIHPSRRNHTPGTLSRGYEHLCVACFRAVYSPE